MKKDNGIWDKIFEAEKNGGGKIDYADFIATCLYDDKFGYYKADRRRVGGDGADFYTSASLKEKVFGQLVQSAAKNILTALGQKPEAFEYAEIGAEPDRQIIDGTRVIRLGQKISLPKNCVLISNELLDARPFSRFKFADCRWRKAFLKVEKIGAKFSCNEVLGNTSEGELKLLEEYFPHAKVEGFRIDLSSDAVELFQNICEQNWRGIFIFADYFRTAQELSEMPNGTARTYAKHKYGGEIWEDAGQCDITYSPCSDIFGDIAKRRGFKNFEAVSQEAFFMRHAADTMEEIISSADPFDMRKRELAQLVNPLHMGAAFRIMTAARL